MSHIQKSFDKDLEQIHNKITMMAEMVSQELEDSLQAFIDRDIDEASDAVAADDLINASERMIDNQIITAIVMHQPVATDLRELISALRISRDLERIGDYANSIANHSTTLDQLEITGEEQRVIDMGHAVLTMIAEVIDAWIKQDADKASLVRQQDEQIDELYSKIFSDLLVVNAQNARLASACTHLIFIARNLERIGDLTTDIAEEILYTVNGQFPDDERAKADETAFIAGKQ